MPRKFRGAYISPLSSRRKASACTMMGRCFVGFKNGKRGGGSLVGVVLVWWAAVFFWGGGMCIYLCVGVCVCVLVCVCFVCICICICI
jgi:hypothetical protein